MFASRTRKQVQLLDGEETVIVTIRKLSHRSLDKAADMRQARVSSLARSLGPEAVKLMLGVGQEPKPEGQGQGAEATNPAPKPSAEERRKARYNSYDRDTILQAGVESWTATYKKLPDGLADLEEADAQKLHEEIVDLSLPPLEEADAEAVEKNA